MLKIEDIFMNLDKRLSAIEKHLLSSAGTVPGTNPTSTYQPPRVDAQPQASVELPNLHSHRPRELAANAHTAAIKRNFTFESSSILGIIGIIFVIMAGVFFIRLTIESGWLTPIRQILIAAGTGVILFIAPLFSPKAEREYGALLAGAGTTILHLAWLGGYFYHHIIGAVPALVCATLVGVLSIAFNFDKGNRLYVLVAMAGTYLAAPVIGYNAGEFSTLSIFLVIWNISFSAIAFANKRREILFIASYYAVFTVLLLSGRASSPDQYFELLILQIIQFIIFSAMLVSYSLFYKDRLNVDESVALLPLLILFYFSSGHIVSQINPQFSPWFGMAIGGSVLAIYLFVRRFLSKELNSAASLTSFATIAFVHSFFFQLLDVSVQPLAALLIGIFVIIIWNRDHEARKKFKWPLLIFFSTFLYGAVLTVVSTESIQPMYIFNWSYGAMALLDFLKLEKLVHSGANEGSNFNRSSSLLLAFAHFEVMLGIYRFSEQVSGSQAFFITISWALYAALIMGVSYWRRDKILGNSALTILLAVSLKAFFYDVGQTSNLIRVVCLLIEGLLLYGCGWIFKKMQSWKA